MNKEFVAKFKIENIFKITGRGIVFAGVITEGSISIGNVIEFVVFNKLKIRKIIGIEDIRHSQPDIVNIGLIVKIEDEIEIEELLNWTPDSTMGVIYVDNI